MDLSHVTCIEYIHYSRSHTTLIHNGQWPRNVVTLNITIHSTGDNVIYSRVVKTDILTICYRLLRFITVVVIKSMNIVHNYLLHVLCDNAPPRQSSV